MVLRYHASSVRIFVTALYQFSWSIRYNEFNEGAKIYNDHCLRYSAPPIALLSLDDAAIHTEGDEDKAAGESSTVEDFGHPTMDQYCKYCWLLADHHCALESKDEAVYNMKAKYVYHHFGGLSRSLNGTWCFLIRHHEDFEAGKHLRQHWLRDKRRDRCRCRIPVIRHLRKTPSLLVGIPSLHLHIVDKKLVILYLTLTNGMLNHSKICQLGRSLCQRIPSLFRAPLYSPI